MPSVVHPRVRCGAHTREEHAVGCGADARGQNTARRTPVPRTRIRGHDGGERSPGFASIARARQRGRLMRSL
eukprot:6242029-Prymnesium_polylepis.1